MYLGTETPAPVTGAATDEYNLNVVDCNVSVTVARLAVLNLSQWGSGGYPQQPEANVKDNGFPWPPPGLLGFFFYWVHSRCLIFTVSSDATGLSGACQSMCLFTVRDLIWVGDGAGVAPGGSFKTVDCVTVCDWVGHISITGMQLIMRALRDVRI